MLTYALGRGLEAYDVQAVDTIVERIEKARRPRLGPDRGHHRIRPIPETPPIDGGGYRQTSRTGTPAERPNRPKIRTRS